jgi:hypothetical protein
MEYIIGAIVAFLFLKVATGGSFGALSTNFSTLATPSAPIPASTGAELTPAQLTFATQQASSLQSNIGVAESTATGIASKLATVASVGSTFATAIPIAGAVIGAVTQILLAQHTARLKGAISENQLIPTSVQAFDADIAELVTAYNAGQVPVLSNGQSPTCATAIQQMDQSLYSYMKGNATGPGRAWTDVPGANPPISTNAVPACGKACTAECCVFWNDMNNVLAEINRYLTGQPAQTILTQKTATGCNFTIPEVVQPPKQYGTFSRASYTINLVTPSNATA